MKQQQRWQQHQQQQVAEMLMIHGVEPHHLQALSAVLCCGVCHLSMLTRPAFYAKARSTRGLQYGKMLPQQKRAHVQT